MSYTILLVDDVKINRLVMENILSKTEDVFDFIHAPNGEVAKEVLDNFSVDLVISDLMMPQMDGFSLIKWMKSKGNTRQIPIMIYTASHDLASIKTCLNLGISDYFFKPLSQAEVQVIVPLKVKQALISYDNQKKSDRLCILESIFIRSILMKKRPENDPLWLEQWPNPFLPILEGFHEKTKNVFWIFLIKIKSEEAPPAFPLFLTTFCRHYAGKVEAINEVKARIHEDLNRMGALFSGLDYELQIGKIESEALLLEKNVFFHLALLYKNGDMHSSVELENDGPIPLVQVTDLIFYVPPLQRALKDYEWTYKYSFPISDNLVNVAIVDNLQ